MTSEGVEEMENNNRINISGQHACNKVDEINKIHKKMNEMHESMKVMNVILHRLDKEIMGNGRPGLIQRFNKMEGKVSIALFIALTTASGVLVGAIIR